MTKSIDFKLPLPRRPILLSYKQSLSQIHKLFQNSSTDISLKKKFKSPHAVSGEWAGQRCFRHWILLCQSIIKSNEVNSRRWFVTSPTSRCTKIRTTRWLSTTTPFLSAGWKFYLIIFIYCWAWIFTFCKAFFKNVRKINV